MTVPPDEHAARRRYLTTCLLYWLPLGLATAPLVLLLTARGLPLGTVAGLFAAHSLTTAALELPTGGLSDVLGRRPVLAAAGLVGVAAFTLLALGDSPALLFPGMVLLGASRALASGPAEAWYVDAVHARTGADGDLRPGLARGSATGSVALAVGTLVGGAVPWLLSGDLGDRLTLATGGLVLPLAVPVLLGAVVAAVFAGYVLAALAEPPRPPATLRTVVADVPTTIATGLRLGRRNAVVRRVVLTAAATGAGLAVVELLTPGRAADLTGTVESGAVLVGGLACAGFLCSALGARIAPGAAERFGDARAVPVGLVLCATGLLLLAVTANTAGPAAAASAAIGYGLAYLGLGTAGPSQGALLHRAVTADARATALSVQSLALQLVGALAGLALGVLPAGPPRWLLGVAALTLAVLLWLRPPADGRANSDAADGGTVDDAEAGSDAADGAGADARGTKSLRRGRQSQLRRLKTR
ncbi:MFS transporter [Kitasatospora sp. NPDC058201]|uniref:MFS transporter n=1 Tax=unclassified Kitasatospora TaxID=2633591 RepID=UPI00364C79B9